MGRTKLTKKALNKPDNSLTNTKKAAICKRIELALKEGDHHTARALLQEHTSVIDYDREHNNSLLYFWTVICNAPKAVCPRLCVGRDPNFLVYTPCHAVSPIYHLFERFGSETFKGRDGKPLEALQIPVISMGVAAQSMDAVIQIVAHGGLINARIPETGQTVLHVAGLAAASRLVDPHFEHKEAMPSLLPLPQENDRYVGDESKQWIFEACHKMVKTLVELQADIGALDHLGRCCVTSAIAGGQMWACAGMLDVFVRADNKSEQLDYLRFIRELVDVDAPTSPPRTKSLELSPDGLRSVLNILNVKFLEEYQDDAEGLANSRTVSRPSMVDGTIRYASRNVAVEIAMLTRRAMKLKSLRMLTWLCQHCHVEDMHWRCSGQRSGAPLAHIALGHDPAVLRVLFQEINMNAFNQQGLMPLFHACKENRSDWLEGLLEAAPLQDLKYQLQQRDPTHGITPLGHAVAWGYQDAAKVLLKCCRKAELDVNALLDRHQATSLHHLPTFSAVVHSYPEILDMVLDAGLKPEGAAATEHIQVSGEGGGFYLLQPSGSSETVTLAMCAASMGNHQQLEALLRAGASAKTAPLNNQRYSNAITMTLEYPDLDEQMRGESPLGGSPRYTPSPSPRPSETSQPREADPLTPPETNGMSPEAAKAHCNQDADKVCMIAAKELQKRVKERQTTPQMAKQPNGRDTSGRATPTPHQAGLELRENDTEAALPADDSLPRTPSPAPASSSRDTYGNQEDSPSPCLEDLQFWLCDAAPRFRCLELLLQNGAVLTLQQLSKLQSILENCGSGEDAPEEATALARLAKKVRPCAGCSECSIWARCSCKQVWYCGPECQKADWPNHKKLCKAARSRQ